MSENISEVSDSRFEQDVLKSDIPVLVDFWAPWCGPCKAIGPVIDEISKNYAGRVKFFKCNVDDNPVTSGQYGIRAIPTLLLFKGGQKLDQIVGMVDKSKIEQTLNKAL
ncbi:MAG: thioredoxin [Desulfobacterales bacterium CG23_combo_of_CG06-09_8_20_14_all_51_8]|nr:MAG: thioredoxin [Desulfobacterales bacterium CG23_combo_of_CG06-09_8_20_14_all_51_8]